MTNIPSSNWIGGEWVEPEAPEQDGVLDSATGEVSFRAAPSGPADVDGAVSAAAKAFESWSATTPRQPSRALLKIAQAIEDHASQFTELASHFTGSVATGQAVMRAAAASLERMHDTELKHVMVKW